MSMIIDCECSRFTKQKEPLTAKEEITKILMPLLNLKKAGTKMTDYQNKEILILMNALEQIEYLPLQK